MTAATNLPVTPDAVTSERAPTGSQANQLPQPGIGNNKPRLIGIDVTRGLALLGMIAVHALIPYDDDFQPNWVTYVATGHASAVFAVLAGVGLSLTTGRARVPWAEALPTATGVAGRAAAIALIGLTLGYTDAVITGVILPYYALLFLLAIPLLFVRTRTLVAVGILAAVAVPVLSHLVRPGLPTPTLENPTFSYLLTDPVGLLCELLLTGAYPALPWMAYICAGLILGRLTLSSVRVARRMLIFGVALAVSAGVAAWLLLGPLGGRAALQLAGPGLVDSDADSVNDLLTFGFDGTTPTTSWWWLATGAPHAGTPLDLLGTIGTAVGVLGAMLLLGHVAKPMLRRVIDLAFAPLAAAGAMTLTLYAAHVVFMNSPLDVFEPMDGYIFQVAAVLLFGLGWRLAVGRGPLETAVTALATRARTWVTVAISRSGATRPPAGAIQRSTYRPATVEPETAAQLPEPIGEVDQLQPDNSRSVRLRHQVVGKQTIRFQPAGPVQGERRRTTTDAPAPLTSATAEVVDAALGLTTGTGDPAHPTTTDAAKTANPSTAGTVAPRSLSGSTFSHAGRAASGETGPHRGSHSMNGAANNANAPGVADTAPRSRSSRLAGIDITRGLALLGMMAVHTLIPYNENLDPNWVSYIATGHSAATFAVLAGVGISLTTGRARVPWAMAWPTAAAIAARAAAIGAIGLALGYTDASIAGVILPYYALLFVLAIPLVMMRSRAVLLVGLVAAIVVPVLSQLLRPELPAPSGENLTFGYLLTDPLGMLSELMLTGSYPVLPWTAYICAGIVVGRLTLSSARVAWRLLIVGAGLLLAATGVAWVLLGQLGGAAALQSAGAGDMGFVDDLLAFGFDGTTPTTSWWWLATRASHAGTPLDLIGTIGGAVGLLGAMLLLGQIAQPILRRAIGFVTAPIAAAGAMTLTLYTAHVVFMNSQLEVFSPTTAYALQVVGVLIFGLAWRRFVGRGPLETAVSAISTRARAWAGATEPSVPSPEATPGVSVVPAERPQRSTTVKDAASTKMSVAPRTGNRPSGADLVATTPTTLEPVANEHEAPASRRLPGPFVAMPPQRAAGGHRRSTPPQPER